MRRERRARRRQLRFNVGGERFAIHRAVDHPGCDEAVASQPSDEGLGMPFAERRISLQPFSAQRPPAQAAHVGLHRCFIDEDEAARLTAHRRLAPAAPFKPRRLHV